jgi:hypothetical protein
MQNGSVVGNKGVISLISNRSKIIMIIKTKSFYNRIISIIAELELSVPKDKPTGLGSRGGCSFAV